MADIDRVIRLIDAASRRTRTLAAREPEVAVDEGEVGAAISTAQALTALSRADFDLFEAIRMLEP